MAKESFLNKALKKTVGAKTDAAWSTHAQVFGPLMEDVFTDNETARVHLIAALNQLSRGDAAGAVKVLENSLKRHCKTDAEKTAWLFFGGLAYEALGQRARASTYWTTALCYGPTFYLVYLKLAKLAHADSLFGFAEQNYKQAIRTLEENPNEPKAGHDRILSSAYCNLASALTMMHRFDEAEAALARSEVLYSQMPERESAKAILYAARGEKEKAETAAALFAAVTSPFLADHLKKMTADILAQRHPHFHANDPEMISVYRFWAWFEARFKEYRRTPAENQAQFAEEISEKLKSVFPFMERPIEVSVCPEDHTFFFADYYALTLSCGLETLFKRMPSTLKEDVRLVRIH